MADVNFDQNILKHLIFSSTIHNYCLYYFGYTTYNFAYLLYLLTLQTIFTVPRWIFFADLNKIEALDSMISLLQLKEEKHELKLYTRMHRFEEINYCSLTFVTK